jgi:transaldolase
LAQAAAAASNLATVKETPDMKATQYLHDLGQSIWLDNITRQLLKSGTLKRYIDELSVTGLTSNPTIFDNAISKSKDYDDDIAELVAKGKSGEDVFFELAIDDLSNAAKLFLPTFERTASVDGWVSLEVSPLLAYDTEGTIEAAKRLHAKAGCKNLFIKIPGTKEGIPAIEEAIFSGVPVNVTLLFSTAQYVAAAEAYIRGLERRVEAGLSPDVRSVASIFVSRWDRATAEQLPQAERNKLGIAVCRQSYKSYRDLLDTDRFQRLENLGARPQRLLFASTSTKDKMAADTLYISALGAPNTVNTMPEETLLAVADHGTENAAILRDGGDSAQVLAQMAKAGIELDAVAAKLQADGAKSFSDSWAELLGAIEKKSKVLS